MTFLEIRRIMFKVMYCKKVRNNKFLHPYIIRTKIMDELEMHSILELVKPNNSVNFILQLLWGYSAVYSMGFYRVQHQVGRCYSCIKRTLFLSSLHTNTASSTVELVRESLFLYWSFKSRNICPIFHNLSRCSG